MTKLENLVDLLQQRLKTGEYPVGSHFPSEYELAEIFKVNKTTANKAVGILVNSGILARAESRRGGTIVKMTTPYPKGLLAIITVLSHPYFYRIASGAGHAAFEHGYALVPLNPTMAQLDFTMRKIEQGNFQGIITSNYGILQTDLPTVYVDHLMPGEENRRYFVRSDNLTGGKLMAQHLLSRNIRDIAYYCGVNDQVLGDRSHAFISEMEKNGISMKERTFKNFSDTQQSFTATVKKICHKFPKCCAIVCGSDDYILPLHNTLLELGLRMPQDVLLCGYGNLPEIHKLLKFPSIESHPYDVGIRACEKLISVIESEAPENIPLHDLIDVELVPF